MSIVVVGSVTWDVAAYAGRLPKPGETLLGDRYVAGLGGKGANQAIAARRLGAPSRFFGRVGADAFGEAVRRALPQYGLDPADVAEDPSAATALAAIFVGGRGENAIVQAPGANRTMGPDDVARAGDAIAAAKVVLLQLEIPLETTLAAARAARQAGAIAVLDPAPAPQDGVPGSVFMAVDIVTPNEVEAESYAGFRPTDAESGKAAAARLVELGAPAAIVTMGASGLAWAREDETSGFLPAYDVAAVDSVAAGDCFNGALAVALAEGRPFEAALPFAAAAGALATTRSGAAEAAPSLDEATALMSGGGRAG